ncbi:MAG: response regulator transcription factor, partial [Microcystaceae cyanobacterium]
MVEKLLVVDDERLFGEGIKVLFAPEIRAGKIDVVCAYDGGEALNFVKADTNHEIEVILLDLKMPADKMDGFTFLKTLHEQNIYIKTIIITAYSTPENFRQAIREQVLFFFTKPLQRLHNLKEVVEEALNCP